MKDKLATAQMDLETARAEAASHAAGTSDELEKLKHKLQVRLASCTFCFGRNACHCCATCIILVRVIQAKAFAMGCNVWAALLPGNVTDMVCT